jgi:hypothetical protein
VFKRALQQIDLWVATVERHVRAGSECSEDAILADLIANDAEMSEWLSLPKDIQVRERGFCFNSIRGIRDYLEKKGPE